MARTSPVYFDISLRVIEAATLGCPPSTSMRVPTQREDLLFLCCVWDHGREPLFRSPTSFAFVARVTRRNANAIGTTTTVAVITRNNVVHLRGDTTAVGALALDGRLLNTRVANRRRSHPGSRFGSEYAVSLSRSVCLVVRERLRHTTH